MSHSAPRACVIGDPINHSRSPLIHGSWLKRHGLQGSYDKVQVRAEDLAAFVRDMRQQRGGDGYVGCNVTVPHKEAAFALVDEATPRACRMGAVNTLWFEGDRLLGDNTDIEGFLANLDASAPGWDHDLRHAVVLGAGGAARGIVAGLLERRPARLTVVNRTPERARALGLLFGAAVEPAAWSDLPGLLRTADLLVNTTAAGMQGKSALDIDLGPLEPGALVHDIVYVPLETPLLRQARERGHPVVDGLGMLLHQAVPGFEHWFGLRPAVTPDLRALIVADIEAAT